MAEPTDSARATRRRLGRAIQRHRGERSQEDLARSLGVSQASISSWEHGGVDLTCYQVNSIELALGLRPGTLLRDAGYVAPERVAGGRNVLAIVATVGEAVDYLRAAAVLGLEVEICSTSSMTDVDARWHITLRWQAD